MTGDAALYARLKQLEAESNPAGRSIQDLEGVFLHVALHQFSEAADRYAKVRPLVHPGAAERRMRRLLNAEIAVSVADGFYFAGPVRDAHRIACIKARALLAAHDLDIETLLLIECGSAARDFAAALTLCTGAAYLCISAASNGEIEAAAVHELAHCALRSGNRFLDEGAAHYFELLSAGNFPTAALAHLSTGTPPVTARTLLAYDAADDPFFSLLLPDHPRWAHHHGALLFGAMRKKVGMSGVKALYQEVARAQDPGHAAMLIETACTRSIEALEADAGIAAPGPGVEVVLDHHSLTMAFVTGDMAQMTQAYHVLFRAGCATAAVGSDNRTIEAIVLCAVALDRAFVGTLTRFEAAFVRGRAFQHISGQPKTSRTYLLRALMAIARVPSEGSMLDSMLLLDEARTDLEMALARDPDDAMVLACLARLEWQSPEDAVGGRERAVLLYRRIAALPPYNGPIQPTLDYCLTQLKDGAA